jgi:5-methylcytosine-specific restriction endonuclease McrA
MRQLKISDGLCYVSEKQKQYLLKAGKSHQHRYICRDGILTHYFCTICGYARLLNQKKMDKLKEKIAYNLCKDAFNNKNTLIEQPLIEGKSFKKRLICAYCGENKICTIDHIIPRSKGGGNSKNNLVKVCEKCNGDKSNHSLSEWIDKLKQSIDNRVERVIQFSASISTSS